MGLNEESIWSGNYYDKNNTDAAKYLQQIRKLIIDGYHKEAEELIRCNMLGQYNESYLPLGNLFIEFLHGDEITEYERSLNLENSIISIGYHVGGNFYQREYFASYPSKAIIMKFTCDKPLLDLNISFQSELKYSQEYRDTSIYMKLKCPEHVDPEYVKDSTNPVIQGSRGMDINADIEVLYQDGSLKKGYERLHISGAKMDCFLRKSLKMIVN